MMYKYGMRLRGFSLGCQPMNGFVERLDSAEYWDELVYNRKLTGEEVRCYDLEYIGGFDNGGEKESGL